MQEPKSVKFQQPVHNLYRLKDMLEAGETKRIIQNVNVFEFKLNQVDVSHISVLNEKISTFFYHRDPLIVKSFGCRL